MSELHVKIGHWNKLKVIREKDFGVFLEGGQYVDILLPKRYVPENTEIGDELDVFIYLDSNDDVIATTEKPYAQMGEFAYLKAKDVNRIGAFLDWGLSKDLLVPFCEQKQRMQAGHAYIVYIYQENREWRIVASSKIDKFLSNKPPRYKKGQEVDLLICEKTDIGFMAIINGLHQGVIFKNDIHQPIRTGMKITGYIKRIRPDQKIDLYLQRPETQRDDLGDQIIAKLEQNDGFLPLHDKSEPELIKQYFPASKRVFKMAIGGLYKDRKITIESDGIRLITESE
ncbi:S1-like domain-containing RNA-binding protein [Sansalvadorimonas sp. 2012CJ34-2]|uniref:S1-like domain-containing RNA-binding protein n=1 Tax=Parendozoicomonas callyspongiae TaxID=2942213 RepID=A0ABT0PJY3_9GAMM|nr:S1-like domain-containing RNA-binding protein [Sansalvadorimonas sp. 2012CJ34-2]MCL6271697.1 S1-like domain-containing RNA-binding protein [Sansalvadorimonas sp. 2012CJ34-2]